MQYSTEPILAQDWIAFMAISLSLLLLVAFFPVFDPPTGAFLVSLAIDLSFVLLNSIITNRPCLIMFADFQCHLVVTRKNASETWNIQQHDPADIDR